MQKTALVDYCDIEGCEVNQLNDGHSAIGQCVECERDLCDEHANWAKHDEGHDYCGECASKLPKEEE